MAENCPSHILDRFHHIQLEGIVTEKSKLQYYREYSRYTEWKKEEGIDENCNTEAVVGVYLEKRSGEVVPTSLFPILSMIKACLAAEHRVHFEVGNLNSLIKKKMKVANYTPKQAPVFTRFEMIEFWKQDDTKYMIQKIVAILGFCGGLRKCEMIALKLTDIRMTESAAIVNIGASKTNTKGSFAIAAGESEGYSDPFSTFARYYQERAKVVGMDRFLISFRNGRCCKQNVERNTVAETSKMVAKLLGLDNAETYTSHSFRRSSATALIEGGADITTLKRHGRWQSSTVAERYVMESDQHQVGVAKRICFGNSEGQREGSPKPSTSRVEPTVRSTTLDLKDKLLDFGSANTFNGSINININYNRN